MSDPVSFTLRDARDADAAALIDLIGGVFAEYPGCVLDVDGELPELRGVATAFARMRGRFWVAEAQGDGRVLGCGGYSPASEPGGIELRKLYVHKAIRRSGIGSAICDLVEGEARRRGLGFVDLWSDTRFETAHRLYERRGYVRGPVTRDLHDKSASVEYYFRLAL
jgi:putative acetyltransferase